jgi:hypothetical protein
MLVNDMHETNAAEGQILHPGSRALFRHWEAIRAERPAPGRDDLDLAQIRAIVPDLFILDRDHLRQSFRYRLAGTRLCELHRQELTHTDMLTGWDQFECDTIRRLLNTAATSLQPCLVRMRYVTAMSHMIGIEMIAMPMMARDGMRVQILGGMFPFRDISTLGYDNISSKELTGARTVYTEHGAAVTGLRQAPPAAPGSRFRVIQGGVN